MRDRLIELCENLILSCKSSLCEDCEHKNIDYPNCMSVHFADYLLENGVIVPPCKVGDTVYSPIEIDVECAQSVDVGTVFAIGFDERFTMWISVRYESGLKYYYTADEFDKTVFLTREEAEQALKGGEG